MHVIRASRTVTAAAIATVLLPLALSGCSAAAAAPSEHLAELRAARDSNLLALPTEQVYELSEFTITAPSALASLSDAAQSGFRYSGAIVLSDDIITDAEFDFGVTGLQSASFVLTEPTTLRRAENETGPAYAVGELTIGDHLPIPTMVKFTPTTLEVDELVFDIDFDLPSELPFEQSTATVQDLTARIALTAAR